MQRDYLFSSESVARGHPDKVADQIADAILDEIISQDPEAHVAAETLVTTGLALVSGEIRTHAYADIPGVVRRTIQKIGYDDPLIGFDYANCAVLTSIDEQSPDIALGVDRANGQIGAGDQGIMFGYATDETEEYMPLPIVLAHRLMIRLEAVRVQRRLPWLRPDGKGQVSVRYENDHPARVEAVVLSAHHARDVAGHELRIETIRDGLRDEVIRQALPEDLYDPKTAKTFINPTGRFAEGGPKADTGLSGRKIIVDTYGGMAPHGGGSFSGKDPTKVDRSATYAARWVAKNIVAAGLAKRCQIQLAYAIGVAEPVSIAIETYGTGQMDDREITRRVRRVFDLSPRGIIEALDLRRPIFEKTACYGHFGRNEPEFTWERIDRAADLQREG